MQLRAHNLAKDGCPADSLEGTEDVEEDGQAVQHDQQQQVPQDDMFTAEGQVEGEVDMSIYVDYSQCS
jgi:hypothetical protein